MPVNRVATASHARGLRRSRSGHRGFGFGFGLVIGENRPTEATPLAHIPALHHEQKPLTTPTALHRGLDR
jgi:hypothetical protein